MSAGLCERLVRGWVIVNIVLIWKPLHLWEVLNITTSARWNFEEYLFHVMETGSVNLKKGQNKHNENIIRVISMTHILYSLKMLHSVIALKSNVALLDMSDQFDISVYTEMCKYFLKMCSFLLHWCTFYTSSLSLWASVTVINWSCNLFSHKINVFPISNAFNKCSKWLNICFFYHVATDAVVAVSFCVWKHSILTMVKSQ